MAAPTIDPDQRHPADVAPTNSYRPTDPVWIYRGGVWHTGVIESVSSRAATVTYRPSGARGTGVDTLTARYLLARSRTDVDPALDQYHALGQLAGR
jgi:hypothetical protein